MSLEWQASTLLPVENSQPTVLIYSAGFGDGHNSAARSLVAAITDLTGGQVQALKMDLFPECTPNIEIFLKWGYSFVTTHFPRVWGWMYRMAEKDSGKGNLGWRWVGDFPEQLGKHLALHQPAAVLSTFPMYPYLLAEARVGLPQPRFTGTVITDSISINSIWNKAPTDRYFVTDEFSTNILQERGKPAEQIESTGFAVSPHFTKLTPRSLQAPDTDGFRVLYFATSSAREVKETLRGLLTDTPAAVEFTISLGRHEARLGEMVRSVLSQFPQRKTSAIGWSNRIPEMLTEHDLIISKGGGATVHECFAAGTPVLVNYFIPGQEAGNVELLQKRGCGWYCPETKALGQKLSALLADGSWSRAKTNMLRERRPDGAYRIARQTLEAAGLAHYLI
jgi:processive 1,2-diacylglycerol beta-glucosyltransferase